MAYRQAQQRKKRLEKLAKKTHHSYRGGAYYDKDKHRYIRYGAAPPRIKKSYKKVARCKVRRAANLINYNGYRKEYDYWCNVT